MTETGCYMYAVARGISRGDLTAVTGLRDAPLRLIEHRNLTAVVSDVDLDEFGEAGLRQHLEDLGWLEEVARTHHAVVNEVATRAPTAPLRLATICLGDDNVRARLDEWHDALERTLSRIKGRMEWSVKAFAPQVEAEATPPPPGAPGTGAGAAYLMRRKAEAERREKDADRAAALADELHAALSRHAVASRRLAPQDRKLTGHHGTMTLNGAYLVDDADLSEFLAAAQELNDLHPEARIELQGPWPPYSFATLEEA